VRELPCRYFNVYRSLANRADLDAVIHLGDYITNLPTAATATASASGRVPLRPGEASTLEDYRSRYATYRSDVDLQDAHRLHPFIAVWDDHESANDAWSGGAPEHDPSRGAWTTRQSAAYQAYLEWMPVRESKDTGIHLYRSFRFGDLADLVMLDTRGLRDQQVAGTDPKALADPSRSMLGAAQEAWFFDQLRASQRAFTLAMIGQQILFTPPAAGLPVANTICGTAIPRAATASSICSPARRSPTLRFSPATSIARGRWMCRGTHGADTTPRPAPAPSPWSS
jgi:alkaline phosphatase D